MKVIVKIAGNMPVTNRGVLTIDYYDNTAYKYTGVKALSNN